METPVQTQRSLSSQTLSAHTLKIIAIIAMTIDHIAWAFVDTYSIAGILMHLIGRLTAPIMCFFVAEGYAHTRNAGRYALRLLIFALISWFPFIFFEAGGLPPLYMLFQMNMIYTLFLSLLALIVCDQVKEVPIRVLIIIILCLLSAMGDWPIFGVLYVLAFSKNRGNFKKQAFWFSIVSVFMLLFFDVPYMLARTMPGTGLRLDFLSFMGTVGMQAGVFLALPLLYRYNGQKGGGKNSKWLFYIYYPAHLTLLGILQMLLK